MFTNRGEDYKDDNRGLLVVEELLGRRLELGETEEEAWATLRRESEERWARLDQALEALLKK